VTPTQKPPLVMAVETALGTKVLSLRYLPSPAAAAAAAKGSGSAEHAAEVALDDLGQVPVAQPDLGRVLGAPEIDLAPDDEATR